MNFFLGTVLGTKDLKVIKTEMVPAFVEFMVHWEGIAEQQIRGFNHDNQ